MIQTLTKSNIGSQETTWSFVSANEKGQSQGLRNKSFLQYFLHSMIMYAYVQTIQLYEHLTNIVKYGFKTSLKLLQKRIDQSFLKSIDNLEYNCLTEVKYAYSVNTEHVISCLVLLISLIGTILNPLYNSFFKNTISDLSTIIIFTMTNCAFYNAQLNGEGGNLNHQLYSISIIHMLPSSLATFLNFKDQTPFYIAASIIIWIIYLNFDQITLGNQVKEAAIQDINIKFYVFQIVLFYWLKSLFSTNMYEKLLKKLSRRNKINDKNMESYELQVNQMVHELRNPLLVLVSSISLIKGTLKKKNHQQEDLFEVSNNLGEHLIAMINNLMEYSKMKAQKVELNKTSIDILQNVRDLLKIHYYKAQEKGNNLQLFVSQMFPKKVIADEQKLKQIIINLLSNAIKFTNKGVISVFIGWKYEKAQKSENKNEEFQIKYEEDKILFRKKGNPASYNDNDTENLSNYDSVSQNTYNQLDFINLDSEEVSPYSRYRKSIKQHKEQIEESKKNDNGMQFYINMPSSNNNSIKFLEKKVSGLTQSDLNYLTHKASLQQAILQDLTSDLLNKNKYQQYNMLKQQDNESLEKYGIKKQQITNEMDNAQFFQLCDDYLLRGMSNDFTSQVQKQQIRNFTEEEVYYHLKTGSDSLKLNLQHQHFDSEKTKTHDNQISKIYCNTFVEPSNEQFRQLDEYLLNDQEEYKEDTCQVNSLQQSKYNLSPSNIQVSQVDSSIKQASEFTKPNKNYLQVNSLKPEQLITFTQSSPERKEKSRRQKSCIAKFQHINNLNSQLYTQNNYSFQYKDNEQNPQSSETIKEESTLKKFSPQNLEEQNDKMEELKLDFDTILLGNSQQQEKEQSKERIQQLYINDQLYNLSQKEKYESNLGSPNDNDRVPVSTQDTKKEQVKSTKYNFSNMSDQKNSHLNFQHLDYEKQKTELSQDLHNRVTAFFPEDLSQNNSQQLLQLNSMNSDFKINNFIKEANIETVSKGNSQGQDKTRSEKLNQQIKIEILNEHNELLESSNMNVSSSIEKNIINIKNSMLNTYDPNVLNMLLRKEEQYMHSNTDDFYNQNALKEQMQYDFQRFQTMNLIKCEEIQNNRNELSINSMSQLGERGTLIIEIQDTGIGISEKGLINLFQPFQQEDETIAKTFGGTGLGLSICHSFIEIMNGHIDVTSTKGEGTKFKIEIPMQLSSELTLMVDQDEYEQNQCNHKQFEFVICENRKSYGLQKIKNKIKKCTKNYQVLQQSDMMVNQNKSFFKHQNSMKIFVVDYANISENKSFLQVLNCQYDEVQINFQEQNSSATVQQNFRENQSQKKNNNAQIVKFRIPIIVLIKTLNDESKIKKQENMFILRVPSEPNSLKKILALVKRYYTQQVLTESFKSQQNHISEEESEETKSQFNKSDITCSKSNGLSSEFYKMSPLNTYFINHQHQYNNFNGSACNSQQVEINSSQTQRKVLTNRANSAQIGQLQQSKNKHQVNVNGHSNIFRHNNSIGLLPKKRSTSDVRAESSYNNQLTQEEIRSLTSSNYVYDKNLKMPQTQEQAPKIMIVNDDPNVTKVIYLIIDTLRNKIAKNISILKAGNGKEAYEQFQANSDIKCIFMDINMPLMGGILATQKIRQFEELRKSIGIYQSDDEFKVSYILGMSGYNDANQTRECLKSGMDEVLYQTPNMEQMKVILQKVFQ